MSTSANSYKDTLNLPKTAFDMKANLTVREPKMQARWKEQGLYEQIRKARAGRERRVLHDGPPYANGEIHIGHLLNKTLKDIVVRSLDDARLSTARMSPAGTATACRSSTRSSRTSARRPRGSPRPRSARSATTRR